MIAVERTSTLGLIFRRDSSQPARAFGIATVLGASALAFIAMGLTGLLLMRWLVPARALLVKLIANIVVFTVGLLTIHLFERSLTNYVDDIVARLTADPTGFVVSHEINKGA
jgi:hypothetical protein